MNSVIEKAKKNSKARLVEMTKKSETDRIDQKHADAWYEAHMRDTK